MSHMVTGGKKKFGKNLNKLVKPVAPPIVPAASSGNQRNGLLLLSSKKTSGGGLLSKPSTSSSLTTAAAGATPSSGNSKPYFESASSSTHDVLLSAISGKADVNAAPDAWGVAAQQQLPGPGTEKEEDYETPKTTVHSPVVETTSFDDNGKDADYKQQADASEDSQRDYMSRLAKERAAQAAMEEEERLEQQRERASARLKELDQKQHVQEDSQPTIASPSEHSGRTNSPHTRTLWEPPGASVQPQQQRSPIVSRRPEHVHNVSRRPPSPIAMQPSYEQQQPSQQPTGTGPVIHLSSYEDRNRGERSAAPRMLYDPKSGSMVAVKARDFGAAALASTTKKPRLRVTTNAVAAGNTSTTNTAKPTRNIKEKKKRQPPPPPTPPKKRLPRTCGVLYEREEGSTSFRCVDGCEPDLAYGAHSVPGGRLNNPEAYEAYLKRQEGMKKELVVQYNSSNHYADEDYYPEEDEEYPQDEDEDGTMLQTGFRLEDLAPQQPPPIEWVKGDDKLELITGLDDSPMLKPTAKAWAPSQAAIAAAAAAAARKSQESSTEEDDEEDEDSVGSFGLGFDPARDMHGLIQSPVLDDEPADLIASVDLNDLQLEPAMIFGSHEDNGINSRGHIFAFGSSGTWGSTKKLANGDDWNVVSGLFGSTASTNSSNSQPASFLGTWGTGLGGLTLNDNKSDG